MKFFFQRLHIYGYGRTGMTKLNPSAFGGWGIKISSLYTKEYNSLPQLFINFVFGLNLHFVDGQVLYKFDKNSFIKTSVIEQKPFLRSFRGYNCCQNWQVFSFLSLYLINGHVSTKFHRNPLILTQIPEWKPNLRL